MTLLVTIDGAVSCHHRRSRRRSEGSGIPHRVSALVSPSGADPLLRSLRQGAGAQDDREGILFQLLRFAPLDLHKGKKYGWNVYFCCIKETGQPTVK